jgi:hypothetical protein
MAGFIASPAAAAGFRTTRVWDFGVLQGNTSRKVVVGVGGIFTKIYRANPSSGAVAP